MQPKVNNLMEQNFLWEAGRHSATRRMLCLLRKSTINYRVRKILVSVLGCRI